MLTQVREYDVYSRNDKVLDMIKIMSKKKPK